MPRSYRYIKMYEKEILDLVDKGFTQREIGKKLGFTIKALWRMGFLVEWRGHDLVIF